MNNGKTRKYISSTLIAALLVLLMTVNFTYAKQITLTLADSTAPVGLRGNGVKILVEEIEKYTKGNVKVKCMCTIRNRTKS